MQTDDHIIAALQEEADAAARGETEQLPSWLTPESAIVAQSKDPEDYTELDWHITNRPARQGKPDSECELGSCESEASHYVEFLSGTLFFGCEDHVDELLKLRVAKKKKVFEGK
jgi:hypothetical protein